MRCVFVVNSALCFSAAVDDSRAGSIAVQPWSLWALMLSTQIRLFNKLKFPLTHF